MMTLDVHENGRNLTDLVRLAQEQAEVVLVDGSKPVARVLPITGQAEPHPAARGQARTLGLHLGAYETSSDFDAPLPDAFWLGQP